MALPRRSQSGEDGHILLSSDAGEFGLKYPTLWEFLTRTKWENGDRRETGTLLVFVDLGLLKCCLSDRDSGEVAFLAGADFDALMATVESGLAHSSIEWRWAKGGPKKKQK